MNQQTGSEGEVKKSKSWFFRSYTIITFIAAFTIGITVGVVKSNDVLAVVHTYDDLEIFADVLSLVETNYVDPVESKKLIEGAINGMLRTLDPHSSYMTPESFKEMQVETEGEFGGLGIEITADGGWVTVVAPMEETPAWRAGIKSGDKIVKVNGESTHDMNLMDAVRKMRGKKGTPVTITIMRDGFEEPKDFVIVREIIKVASVKYDMMPDNWGYLRIRSFSKDTGAETANALADLKKRGMRGIVLDLRNDPGGLLNQAVEVSEQFLKKGELVVYTKGRIPSQNMRFTAQKGLEKDNNYPMVVLVNNGSASASEIVAGAMQDLKRAILVGSQSFGKGSVQTIIPLGSQGALRLTTARYYTPAGRSIQAKGIDADILIEQPLPPELQGKNVSTEGEASLKGHLTNEGGGDEGGGSSAYVPEDKTKDVQLKAAIDFLHGIKVVSTVKPADTKPAGTKETKSN